MTKWLTLTKELVKDLYIQNVYLALGHGLVLCSQATFPFQVRHRQKCFSEGKENHYIAKKDIIKFEAKRCAHKNECTLIIFSLN